MQHLKAQKVAKEDTHRINQDLLLQPSVEQLTNSTFPGVEEIPTERDEEHQSDKQTPDEFISKVDLPSQSKT